MKSMEKGVIVNNLVKTAEDDVRSAKDMLRLKHYHWSLFLWHLAIEKILKARIVKIDKEIPYIHNLRQLSKSANIVINKKMEKELKEITLYNIEARYDDYKLSFYKKASKEYTVKWVKTCEEIFNLVKKQIHI